ncbi:hypothetical protein ONS95_006751 [Cadophora gregata]|uniref:uncharacterized protein n=1 Tax=Cadophora gregata TaxID=51156 RepID=UPI0026DBC990|nr:uncharacterized protein ONS95_006751 [Cadophora gregata]KAK0101587.1 hypothetical protein ONS95_006751 [Cadophora gregata]KAK0106400.1 hypothetical protein ONS96_004031 [Cadophora gregata f. sp. sojae]
MGFYSSREISALEKPKYLTNEAEAPKGAIRYISIAPPSALQSLQNSFQDYILNFPIQFRAIACIDCQLSDKSKPDLSKVIRRSPSAILQQIFEDELDSRHSPSNRHPDTESPSQHQAQVQYQHRFRPRKSITWDSSIEVKDRTQEELTKYGRTGMVEVKEDWWKDPDQLKACECFLSTGKYLDALMALPCGDVKRTVSLLPPKIVRMIMGISSQVGTMGELAPEEYRDSTDSSDDEPLLISDIGADTGDRNDDANIEIAICDVDVQEMAAHRRLLAEYLDRRLDRHLFCRYSGRLKRPARCPKLELRTQGIEVIYASTKSWGPTAHIVSLATRSDRPLISPIRFSQAYMAMKLYRLGDDCTTQLEFLHDMHGQCLENMANHYVSTKPFISGDRLLLRSQFWIYAHKLEPKSKAYVQNFLNGNWIAPYRPNATMTWACRHINTNPQKYIYDFKHPEEAAKLRRCAECAFEYQIDTVKSIPVSWTSVSPRPITEGFCAVITVWRDFGRCLTPYDPRWAAHFAEYTEPTFTSRFPARNQQLHNPAEEEPANDWELGGIMRAYEGCDELIETERSLHRAVLKIFLSTKEERLEFEERDERKEKLKEIETQRQLEEEDES